MSKERLTEDNQILSNASMDDIHATHCSTGVVEYPLLVQVNIASRQLLAQLGRDVADHALRVIAVCGNCTLREIMQLSWLEDVEILVVVLNIPDGVDEDCQDQEDGGKDRCAGAAAGLCGSGSHF